MDSTEIVPQTRKVITKMANPIADSATRTLYKGLVSISLGGALLGDCWLNIDFVLELEGSPSIHQAELLSINIILFG